MKIPKLDFVITSYEAGVEKPNSKIFRKAIEAANVKCEPSEALHIGNEMDKDFEGARNAGWNAILINSEAKAEPNFKNIEDFWNAITSSDIKLLKY